MFNSKKKKEKGPNDKPADPTKRKRRDSLSLVRRMGTEKAKAKPRKDMHTDSSTNIGPGAVENNNSRESLEDHEPSPRVVEFSDSPSRPTPPRATVTMSEVCLSTKYYEDDKIVQDEDEQATLNRARSFKIRDERRMAELVDFANNHVGKGVVSQATFGKDLSDGLGFLFFCVLLFASYPFFLLFVLVFDPFLSVFLHLLYKLTGQMPRIYSQNPKYQIQKVDNIHVVLRILATQYRLQVFFFFFKKNNHSNFPSPFFFFRKNMTHLPLLEEMFSPVSKSWKLFSNTTMLDVDLASEMSSKHQNFPPLKEEREKDQMMKEELVFWVVEMTKIQPLILLLLTAYLLLLI